MLIPGVEQSVVDVESHPRGRVIVRALFVAKAVSGPGVVTASDLLVPRD